MSRIRNPDLEGLGISPAKCRAYARMLLDLADALDAGTIRIIDRPYAVHSFVRPIDLSRVLDDDKDMPTEPMNVVQCKHDLTAHAFYLVFAQCLISKEFFIAPKRTKMLTEQFRYLSP